MSLMKEKLLRADKLLRQAKLSEAAKLVPKNNFNELSREERLLAANISRRTYNIRLGLKLLHPVVFSEKSKPLEKELAEYTVLLMLNGGFSEAKRLLNLTEKPKHPETLLAKTWAHFGAWEFRKAIPVLLEYIELQKDPYFKLAGRINLSEALFEIDELSRCEHELHDLIKELSLTSFNRLRANALHIQGMLFHAQGKLKESQVALEEGLKLFGKTQASDKLLLLRQMAINRATQLKNTKPLRDFRSLIIKNRAWDSLRKFDIESLKIEFDQDLFNKLYFGTPYKEFRNILVQLFPHHEKVEAFYWGDRKGGVLDLASGKLLSGREPILSGNSLKLLNVFSRDIYTPLKIGDIFSGLFPGEHFHFAYSPNRVRQNLHRFRQDIDENNLPISLSYRDGFYYLKPLKGISILKSRQILNSDPSEDPQYEKLKTLTRFSRKEAMALLNLPKATAIRLLGRYVAEGKIHQTGTGRSIKYHIV